MATLETQYKNYKLDNPDSTFTFEEWKQWLGENLKKELEKFKEDVRQHRDNQTTPEL
jgi:hypothetical protein